MNNIVFMPVGDVKPYPNNPRDNKDAVDKVAESIKEFGFQQPIVVDKDNVVIVGHTRLKAAKKLKLKVVPAVVAEDLSEEQANAYRLADNKTNEFAEWDMDKLLEELQGITEFDMTDFGFDLDFMKEEDEVVEVETLEPPEVPKTQPGQLFQLGRHRLLCGDATSVEDISKLMGGKLADLYLTDPPYNVAYEGATKDKLTIMNDSMGDEQFREFLQSSFYAAKANMKGGASFYIWHADSEGYNFRGACHDIGWQVRECLIWKKNTMVLGRQDYQWKHEPCLYGWNEGGSHAWYSDRKQTTVLDFDKPARNGEHPTMKPVALFDYLMKNSSKKDDIVLDSFGGSGTTIIAAEQNGRCGYCTELDPKYCDVIIERWENLTGQKAELIKEE